MPVNVGSLAINYSQEAAVGKILVDISRKTGVRRLQWSALEPSPMV
jgi:hypothetical protein